MKAGAKKEKLRRLMKKKRDSISLASRKAMSRKIAKTLRELPTYRKARTVMFYVSFGSEVITNKMIMSAVKEGKNVVVPFLGKSKEEIKAAKITSAKSDLIRGAFGIKEPKPRLCKEIPHRKIDLVVVPAVVFDKACQRVGYGKGYYDRWLKKIPLKARIGIAFDAQVIEKIPECRNDIPVSMVITDKRTIVKNPKGEY